MSVPPTNQSSRRSVQQASLILGALVAAYVPVMQLVVDQSQPRLSKPVIAGLVLGALVAALAILPRGWNLKLLFVSIVGIGTLGIAEAACSFFFAPVSSSIYDWDARCLYKPVPLAHKRYRRTAINGGQTIDVRINSQGYRGPELPQDRGVPRIMVYGDSFIEAEYSALEHTFCEQLREGLSRQLDKPVAVINAGANGYGPDQVLLRMETELPVVKPQVVVVSIFADNDYGDLLRNKLFRADDSRGRLNPNPWQRADDCRHPGMGTPWEPALWRLARNAIRGAQSRGGVIESYMERWLAQCQSEFDEDIVQRNSLVHDLQADHYDADLALTPTAPSSQYKIELFGRVLKRIAEVCRRNGAELLVMIIPSPADLIEGYDFCAIDHQKYPDYDPHRLSNVAVTAAKKLNIPAVNLFDAFSANDPGSLYFRGGDNHWNDAGQKLAAEVMAPEVLKHLPAASIAK